MKSALNVMGLWGTTASPIMVGGREASESNLLVILFLGFGALIIVCQLIPGLMLFCSMIKGLFTGAVKKTVPVAEENEKKI